MPLLDLTGRACERHISLDLNQSATHDAGHKRSCLEAATVFPGVKCVNPLLSEATEVTEFTTEERSNGDEHARDALYRAGIPEPVSAVVGATDRVGQQYHPCLRRRLGRGCHQDHRSAPGGERRRPEDEFLHADADSYRLSMQKRPGTALHSSWNWELISDKPLDWWLPRLARIKRPIPTASSSPRSWPVRETTGSSGIGRRSPQAARTPVWTRSS